MPNGDSYKRRSNSTSSSRYKPPTRKGISRRALFSVITCLIMPPLGVFVMWFFGIFKTRGRIIMTVLATAMLTLYVFMLLPAADVIKTEPQAVVSRLATAYPEDEELTALSNMDELLSGVENKTAAEIQAEEVAAATEAPSAEPGSTIVYAVRSGAKYYHAASTCNGTTLKRTLTVLEAYNEGLKPCPKCNPPTE